MSTQDPIPEGLLDDLLEPVKEKDSERTVIFVELPILWGLLSFVTRNHYILVYGGAVIPVIAIVYELVIKRRKKNAKKD